jgi:hypothetical protein
MYYRDKAIGRLATIRFLLEETLKLADAGGCLTIGAKLSDCLTITAVELEAVYAMPTSHPDEPVFAAALSS